MIVKKEILVKPVSSPKTIINKAPYSSPPNFLISKIIRLNRLTILIFWVIMFLCNNKTSDFFGPPPPVLSYIDKADKSASRRTLLNSFRENSRFIFPRRAGTFREEAIKTLMEEVL